MTKEELVNILDGEYCFFYTSTVCLDGNFTIEQLEAILKYMKESE